MGVRLLSCCKKILSIVVSCNIAVFSTELDEYCASNAHLVQAKRLNANWVTNVANAKAGHALGFGH